MDYLETDRQTDKDRQTDGHVHMPIQTDVHGHAVSQRNPKRQTDRHADQGLTDTGAHWTQIEGQTDTDTTDLAGRLTD